MVNIMSNQEQLLPELLECLKRIESCLMQLQRPSVEQIDLDWVSIRVEARRFSDDMLEFLESFSVNTQERAAAKRYSTGWRTWYMDRNQKAPNFDPGTVNWGYGRLRGVGTLTHQNIDAILKRTPQAAAAVPNTEMRSVSLLNAPPPNERI